VPTFLADVRYGARVLLRSPGFTFVAVAALAIGIGANLTIFGFAKELLLSPPRGVADADRVVRAFTNRFSNTGFAEYEAYRDRNHTFVALAAFRAETMGLRTEGAPEQIFGLAVSGNYFNALGVPAAIGRPLLPADDRPDAPGVVVISDRFWRLKWASNPDVLGQVLTLNGRPATVVGVAPIAFTGTMAPLVPDVFTPITQSHRGVATSSVQMIGRLRPGVPIGEAQADLTTLAAQLVEGAAQDRKPMLTVYAARTLGPEIAVPAAVFAGALLAVVGLVLLLACVNIANLLLSRSAARTREIGIRAALGASRGRLVRQLLTESLLLSAAGGAGAAILAIAAARPIAAAAGALPSPAPLALAFVVDWRLTAAAIGLSVLTTVAFGLVPALQSSKHDVLPALKDGAGTAGPKQSRLRGVFLTTQVAMSTLLLVVAALFVRGLVRAHTLDRGLVTGGVLAASIDLESSGYAPDRGALVYQQLRERLEETPGIAAANIVDLVPLTLSNRANQMVTEGPLRGKSPLVYSNRVSPGHFRTLGIPLLSGRDFDARDRAQAAGVAIVNETIARLFWPGENPVGKRLRERTGREVEGGLGPWLEVVGVARDSKYVTVGEDPKPFMYRPIAQDYTAAAVVLVKARGVVDVLPAVRSAVAALDPNLPIFNIMTLDAATSISLLPVKVAAAVAGTLGILALVLGAIGLYGVMSYLVRQRTREIGIRMALGAQSGAVIDLVTRHGMRWTAIGLVLGLAASLAVAKLIEGFLYGIGPADPTAFIGIALLLSGTAYAACYIPAKRASRLDPLMALREE
jgi:predicted permease